MIIAATGHRPDKLGGYDITSRRALGAFAAEYLYEREPDSVITGMALGWDQAVAAACVLLRIPFVAAVPCPGQEKRWPEESQARYCRLIGAASEVVIVSEFYSAHNMQVRNKWMVDRADEMMALWDGSPGGTGNCILNARSHRKTIVNLWGRWVGADEFDALLG